MSGLVNGLQNRLQQFESARHLLKRESQTEVPVFFIPITYNLPFVTFPLIYVNKLTKR